MGGRGPKSPFARLAANEENASVARSGRVNGDAYSGSMDTDAAPVDAHAWWARVTKRIAGYTEHANNVMAGALLAWQG